MGNPRVLLLNLVDMMYNKSAHILEEGGMIINLPEQITSFFPLFLHLVQIQDLDKNFVNHL